MNIDILGNIAPLYLVGDSHSLNFTELMFATRQPAMRFRCDVTFFFKLHASDYLVGDLINPLLTETLKSKGMLDDNGEPAWRTPDASTTYLSGRPALPPTLIFFAGEVDLQNMIAEFGNTYDFELPDDPGYGVSRDKSPAPFASVQARIDSRFGPFVEAMSRLRKSFPGLMVHALPPRDRDDERAQHWSFKVKVDAAVRAKLLLAVNRYLAARLRAAGVPFIDPTDALGVDGYLRPEFALDGMHVNRAAAPVMLDRMIGSMLDDGRSRGSPIRYAVLEYKSGVYKGAIHPAHLSWAENGYLLDKIDPTETQKLAEGLTFQAADSNLRASPDWTGYPRAGRPGVEVAEPSARTLERAAWLFRAGHPQSVLHVGQEHELTIINFRPIRIAPGGDVSAGGPPALPGCRRALLFLSPSGFITVATLSGEALVKKSVRAGAIAVWDPARFAVHARAGAEPVIAAEIMAMPLYPTHPFRVAWVGLNEWPADPFQYPVADVLAFPPFETDLVRERA